MSLDRAATVFRCPECRRAALHADGDKLKCSACGWSIAIVEGVIDLLRSSDKTAPPAVRSLVDEQARGIIETLGLAFNDDDYRAVTHFLEPLPPTGNTFFDAEEDIFVDRFGIVNRHPRSSLGPLYLVNEAMAGDLVYGAVRIRNDGAFPLVSEGENPFLISYHIYRNGSLFEFEGARTALPVKLEPDGSVTVPFCIRTPAAVGVYEIRVVPLQEGVAWHEDAALSTTISIVERFSRRHPDRADGRSFSGALDGELASIFVDRYMIKAEKNGIILEIGGGIRPIFSESKARRSWIGTFINTDISMRALGVAVILAAVGGMHGTIHARLDANVLPMADNSVNAIIVSRAIHRFEDLNVIIEELSRVLKKGGQLFLLCEPIGIAYDDHGKGLIRRGVNKQVFPEGIYEKVAKDAGLDLVAGQCDWGFSFKGCFAKHY